MPRNTSASDQARFTAVLSDFQKAAANNLNDDEKRLMQRIEQSVEAIAIFAKTKDDTTVKRLLSLCIEVDFLAKNFAKLIAEARRALAKGPILERAIADVAARR